MGKIIGITGGIASGKSTVTEFLRQKGFQVVDADAVVLSGFSGAFWGENPS